MTMASLLSERYGAGESELPSASDNSDKVCGKLIVIVGPSGSGKDSMIRILRQKLVDDNRYLFVRRYVTRPETPSTEEHASLTHEQFDAARQNGQFAVTWQAHGLQYGIPIEVRKHIALGGTAIVNGSRRALWEISTVFPESVIVNIVVEPHILRERLISRGRETEEQLQKRLEQASIPLETDRPILEIDNSDTLEAAAKSLLQIVRPLALVNTT